MMTRRQHSLQRELIERKQRLKRMRALRLEAVRELRERAEAEEKVKQEELEKKRLEKENAKTITGIIGDKLKSTLRNTADDCRRYKVKREQNLDAEEEKMATYIRLKTKVTGLEAIRKIKITGTQAETQQFQKQNDILAEKGLPFYKKMNRGIGSQGDVFLWIEMTRHSSDIITYKFVGKDRQEKEHCNQRHQRIGDEEMSLNNFGLPDIFLRCHKVDKDDKAEGIYTNAIISELLSIRKMIKVRS